MRCKKVKKCNFSRIKKPDVKRITMKKREKICI